MLTEEELKEVVFDLGSARKGPINEKHTPCVCSMDPVPSGQDVQGTTNSSSSSWKQNRN